MSRARHKANGGSVKQVWNAGGEQNAAKEALEKKHGGKVHSHGEGEKAKERHDRPRRARGGHVTSVTDAKHHSMHHTKPPHRASGGRVRGEGIGADRKPLSSAATVKHVTAGETPESGDDKVM